MPAPAPTTRPAPGGKGKDKEFKHVFADDDDAPDGDETNVLEVELPESVEWQAPAAEPETDDPLKVEGEDEPEPAAAAAEPEANPARDVEMEGLKEEVAQMKAHLMRQASDQGKQLMAGQLARIDSDLQATREAMAAAMDAGDTQATIKAQDKLAELHAARRAQVIASEQVERQPAPPQQSTQPAPLTARWLAQNPWFGAKGNGAETAAARAIDAEMVQEGYAASTPEYYEEMNRRLASKFKSLKVGSIVQRPQRTAVAPQGAVRTQAAPAQKKNTITLTTRDRTIMRQLGMDTNDPATIKSYAVAKLQNERSKA